MKKSLKNPKIALFLGTPCNKNFLWLDFVTVRGSGHFVPGDKPREALQMIYNYVNQKDYSAPVPVSTQPQPLTGWWEENFSLIIHYWIFVLSFNILKLDKNYFQMSCSKSIFPRFIQLNLDPEIRFRQKIFSIRLLSVCWIWSNLSFLE